MVRDKGQVTVRMKVKVRDRKKIRLTASETMRVCVVISIRNIRFSRQNLLEFIYLKNR
jgi:hypothetical protein